MKHRVRLLPLALLAALPLLQGCLVTSKTYRKLKADRDRLAELLDQRESEQRAAEDNFNKRLEAINQELDLAKKEAAGARSDADKAGTELDKLKKTRSPFAERIRQIGVGEARDDRLVLQDKLLFQLGSATLTSAGLRDLGKVAAAFKNQKVTIRIDGHTDTTPIKKKETLAAHGDNMGLSAHRALAVYRALAATGIPERKMYICGFGTSKPAAANTTEAGKKKNRRVEILFEPGS